MLLGLLRRVYRANLRRQHQLIRRDEFAPSFDRRGCLGVSLDTRFALEADDLSIENATQAIAKNATDKGENESPNCSQLLKLVFQ